MPSFANPFAGNVDRKMTNAELMQALRLDIAGELEAIYLYESHYLATDDPAAKAVLGDIRDEEKAHMGELITLMRHLDPKETEFFLDGEGEVKEMLEDLGIATDGEIAPAPAEPAAAPTVGDLA
ncbi:demethoxyubiquinone hydroxylase family protein [Gordonibacter massiliensis (ex Traore et al. 2017)]|uniref:Demethoxyubiquinone hydroxylase family protein n=1 Tax=Gordonibacter massiliensis (ex Traore et al. 2017) TaxID=1841863 RepID=A0A842JAR6_9ACTN|nr:demethoxyubiquinone hydroxylase family protein [Gordonibacter massiliensis (ex Traore et al. 2017)]MBC2887896.1 demethoxyubiquinone hydroxylase family protein [Gordonibacter massiliensis (ex Traore et al. 2017)]